MKPLRVCRICGFTAYTLEEVENFKKSPSDPYGRLTLCKKCGSNLTMEWKRKHIIRARFSGILTRCYNKNWHGYHYWGGRGITICDEWLKDPNKFVEWAQNNGFSPELTIERRDNDGPYSPDNCTWIKLEKQNRNKTTTVTDYENKMKICWSCHKNKPFSEFHRNKSNLSGIQGMCKACCSLLKRKH